MGPQGKAKYQDERRREGDREEFFKVYELGRTQLKPAATSWHANLVVELKTRNSQEGPHVKAFLKILEGKVLHINPLRRETAGAVAHHL